MEQQKICEWLAYWSRAKAVATKEIQSLEQMAEARKWCAVMRQGLFQEARVSTEEMWKALQWARSGMGWEI